MPDRTPLRVVVTGASGNVGAGVLRALSANLPTAEVVGVCRRPPTTGKIYECVRWHAVDLASPTATAELAPTMDGADVVVHLALAIRPVNDEDYLYRANVVGTQAVLDAMITAGVPQLIYASSLGIYAPHPSGPVSEESSTSGQPRSTYSRHKVAVEHLLDDFEANHPDVTVARFRPTVVVQRQAASEIRSLYVGPLVPRAAFDLLRRGRLPVLPLPTGLALQFVHADDVGDAVYRLVKSRARGSFNIAADVLDSTALAGLVGARPVPVNPALMRAVVAGLNRFGLIAVTGGWYLVATNSPLMDTSKARRDLDWKPAWSSADSARELIDGLADGVVGPSAAMGLPTGDVITHRTVVDRVHNITLMLWGVLAVARATAGRRAGPAVIAVIGANLISGTPMALARVAEHRRDPVALTAPVAVGAAVLSARRGGWMHVAATAVLGLLAVAERQRKAGHR
jgi:UDP-glucose 4-epimerase